MKKEENVERRRCGKTILKLTGVDFASSTRAAEDRTIRWKRLLQSHLRCKVMG